MVVVTVIEEDNLSVRPGLNVKDRERHSHMGILHSEITPPLGGGGGSITYGPESEVNDPVQ